MRQQIKSNIGWLISKALYDWNPIKERRKKNFYKQFIASGDLCFDIGAHLGDRTRSWLSIGAKVLAVEPQPRFAEHLRNKFGSQANFQFEQIGVGAEAGQAEMMISTMYPTLSTLAGKQWTDDIAKAAPMSIDFDQKIQVKVRTMDELISDYGKPKFCKIDVEGFEEQVLLGMNTPIRTLSFEFLSFDEDSLKSCLDRLVDLGYNQFNWSYQESFKLQMPNWGSAKQTMERIVNYKQGTYSGDVYARVDKSRIVK